MPALSGAVTVTAVYAGPSAQVWFAGGERVGYDLKARAIVAAEDAPLRILLRREGDVAHAVTFLPGFPDGSFGWAKVLPYLDLVEAIWRDLSVQSTTPVAFDFSTLVVLEHLRCRLERSERGEPPGGPNIRGVFMFNGGLFTDGHSHPWYTTPLLRRLPNRARRRLGRPPISSNEKARRVSDRTLPRKPTLNASATVTLAGGVIPRPKGKPR